MDKVYLMLRNNQEKGPFTFDELLQQKLKSSDLIWVEGKSEAWAYPEELEELKHISSKEKGVVSVILPQAIIEQKTQPVEEKKTDILVENHPTLSPRKDLEKRAEETKRKALAFKQDASTEPQLNVFNTTGYYKVKREIPVSYKSNKKLVPASHLVIVAIASVLAAGWLYGDWSFINPQPGTTSSAVTTYNGNQQSTEENEAKEVPTNETAASPIEEVQASAIPVQAFKKSVNTITTKSNEQPVLQTASLTTQEQQPQVQVAEPVQETVQTPIVVAKVEKVEKQVADNDNDAEPAEVEKKKKGGFLKGLFKKKKKDDAEEVDVN